MHATIVSTKEAETRAGVLGHLFNTERLKKDHTMREICALNSQEITL